MLINNASWKFAINLNDVWWSVMKLISLKTMIVKYKELFYIEK